MARQMRDCPTPGMCNASKHFIGSKEDLACRSGKGAGSRQAASQAAAMSPVDPVSPIAPDPPGNEVDLAADWYEMDGQCVQSGKFRFADHFIDQSEFNNMDRAMKAHIWGSQPNAVDRTDAVRAETGRMSSWADAVEHNDHNTLDRLGIDLENSPDAMRFAAYSGHGDLREFASSQLKNWGLDDDPTYLVPVGVDDSGKESRWLSADQNVIIERQGGTYTVFGISEAFGSFNEASVAADEFADIDPPVTPLRSADTITGQYQR